MKEITLVVEDDEAVFIDDANDLLRKGWKLCGGMSVVQYDYVDRDGFERNGFRYVQMMSK